MHLAPLPLPAPAQILQGAEARLRRQRGYARPLAGRPAPARRLEAALTAARAELSAGMAPAAAWRPVEAAAMDADRVRLDGVALDAPRLTAEVSAGGAVCLWLCTLGPVPAPPPDPEPMSGARAGPGPGAEPDAAPGPATSGRPDGDDALMRHVAGDLAQQALYAAARAAHAGLAARHPGQRLVRVALRPRGARLWDAAAVLRLLPLLGPAPLGVTCPQGTGLWPIHTLLGVTVVRAS